MPIPTAGLSLRSRRFPNRPCAGENGGPSPKGFRSLHKVAADQRSSVANHLSQAVSSVLIAAPESSFS